MSRVVRQSAYRHVFGTAFKPEHCFSSLRPKIGAHDSNQIKANGQFFAIPWTGGGGSVAVLKHTDFGKKAPELPTLSGHTAEVLDWDFNPFNDYILATGSADTTVKVWGIPEGGLTQTITEPLLNLNAHQKKIGVVQFHPTSSNVLLTADFENQVKLWDIEQGKEMIALNETVHSQVVQSVSWNRDGSAFASTCKDKKLRIVDPRASSPVFAETEGHQGTKASKALWLGKMDKIFSVGFTKLAERHYMMFDPRNMSTPMKNEQIDVSSGLILPFFDEDTGLLFLVGKGDGNIRYYEVVNEEPYLYMVSEFKSNTPQRGACMLPKTAMDTSLCEVARLLKLTNDTVTPIMFQVPRKSELFQADIYPDTAAPEPAQTASDYFAGQNAAPKLASMKPGENNFKAGMKLSDFVPKVSTPATPKTPTSLPPKTNDPKELLKQNEELRAKVAALEEELAALKSQLSTTTSE